MLLVGSSWSASQLDGDPRRAGLSLASFIDPNSGYDLIFKLTERRILSSFIITNIPQVLISYIYLGLNYIMTTMLAMREWWGIQRHHKSLQRAFGYRRPFLRLNSDQLIFSRCLSSGAFLLI